MSEKQVQINLRRSSCRRSGEIFTHNFLGVSMQDHTKEIQKIMTDWYMRMVNRDLPEVLLKHGFIEKKEQYKAEEHAKYIGDVLDTNLDKLEAYVDANIFGRKEILSAQKKMERKRKKMCELAHTVGRQMIQLIRERNSLALERAERNYRAELAAKNLRTKKVEQSQEQLKRGKELDNRTKTHMLSLKELNEREKDMFATFLQKK